MIVSVTFASWQEFHDLKGAIVIPRDRYARPIRARAGFATACVVDDQGDHKFGKAFHDAELNLLDSYKLGERSIPAGSNLYRQDEPCHELFNLLGGWVAQYRLLRNGRRQIIHFALPGAFLGYQPNLFGPMQHGALCLTSVSVSVYPRRPFPGLLREHAELAARIAWLNAQDAVAAQDYLTNVGGRAALPRVANLLLDLYVRVRAYEPTSHDGAITLPLTQDQIADATGLTSVYVNKTLKRLRDSKLIALKGRALRILDFDRLADLAEYDLEAAMQEARLELPAVANAGVKLSRPAW